jgi:hypothetical protein
MSPKNVSVLSVPSTRDSSLTSIVVTAGTAPEAVSTDCTLPRTKSSWEIAR